VQLRGVQGGYLQAVRVLHAWRLHERR
jgi:hypothetical protein